MAGAHFSLHSSEFQNGEHLKGKHAKDGDNSPPALTWDSVPEGTRSLCLVMDDPDAPNGTFTHWLQYDIPPDQREINGGRTPGKTGCNDFQDTAYDGPRPPAGHGEHRYFFRLHALDVESLGLEPGATREEIERAIEGHILGTAETMGRFSRGRRQQ